MTDATEPPGLHADARTYLNRGTEDDGRAWLGRTVVRDAPYPVLALDVPLPGTTLINVATTTDFTAPMRDGDLLSFHERLTDLTPTKTTALGTGHFLTTVTEAYRSDGTHVGTNQNVMFRYRPADGDTPGQQRAGHDRVPSAPADAGESLPEARLALTTARTAAMIPAGTRDLFPGHHDRAYARSQGAADIYVNTMFLHGLVDRVGKAWAGPDAWLERRTLRMHTPACVGTSLWTDGRVTARHRRDGRAVAEVAIDVLADDQLAAAATLTFDLDGLPGAPT